MPSSLIVVLLIASIAVGALVILARQSRSANPPGLVESKLQLCAQSSNCVCSENGGTEASTVDPFSFSGSASVSGDHSDNSSVSIDWEKLIGVLVADGAKIVDQSENYLAATYTSKFFGFVDDVELRLDAQTGLLQVRSASRAGKSDLGINRSRVERLRRKFSSSGIRSQTQ